MRPQIAAHFRDRMFPSGLTTTATRSPAPRRATIAVYEEDDLIANARRMGPIMKDLLADLERRHPIVGATQSIGLFGIARARQGQEDPTAARPVRRDVRRDDAICEGAPRRGLYTFVRWHLLPRTRRSVSPRRSSVKDSPVIDEALARSFHHARPERSGPTRSEHSYPRLFPQQRQARGVHGLSEDLLRSC